MTRASAATLAIALLALAGCAGNGPRSPSVSSGGSETYRGAPSGRPLAAYAGQRVAVLPLQSIRRDDALGWGARLASADTALAVIDTSVARAVKERGLGTWVGSAAVARAARMNPTYAPDPHALPLALLAPAERRPDVPIEDPLASQLRTLAALSNARFLLLPLQMRFEPRQQDGKTTGGRAVLELALIDARLAQLLWRGSVSSDVTAAFSPALATAAAARVPDLVVSR